MYRHSTLLLGLLVLTGAHCHGQTPSPFELPDGPMQAKATTACTECHESRIIVQQRLSKAAWAKEVDKMIKWGALVDPQDKDALVDYLSTNFPADKPDYVPDRSRGSEIGTKKR
jgi:hypothetical protein